MELNFKSVKDIGDVAGKRVFLRLDLNVPLLGEEVADDFRIKKSLPTIEFLRSKGANLILASHSDPDESSLRPVYEYLKKYFPISFVENYYPEDLEAPFVSAPIILLENLRKYKGEKENSDGFAKHLAGFAQIYVNESFPVSHRKHASVVSLPKLLPSFAGLSFEEEVENLSQAFTPKHPFLFVLGGAKFETKIPLLRKFFSLADKVFVGGALANDFFKFQGFNVGRSVVSEGHPDLQEFFNDKLILPADMRVKSDVGVVTKKIEEIKDGEKIVDLGPDSLNILKSEISLARFVLWNGPLGHYEMGFKEGTAGLASEIASSQAVSIVGGGDTIASIAELGLEEKFTFVSAAGGAMLDFLANETLPGIEALKD